MGELKVVLVGVGGVGKSASTITYVSNIWISDYGPLLLSSLHFKLITWPFVSFFYLRRFVLHFLLSSSLLSIPRCPLPPPSVLHGRTLSLFL
jgi:GTPase SAR1 family protein